MSDFLDTAEAFETLHVILDPGPEVSGVRCLRVLQRSERLENCLRQDCNRSPFGHRVGPFRPSAQAPLEKKGPPVCGGPWPDEM